MSDINLSGFLFNASGVAVSGATVEAFAKNTVTETGGTAVSGGSTTTNSSGYYSMSLSSDNEHDVRITSGNSVRWRRFDDRLQIEEIEVSTLNIREGATAQVYTIAPGSITADRTLTLPAATGNDTLASLGLAQTFSANQAFTGTVTVGTDGSGTDVIFYSGTAGDNLTWDASEELLTITGTDGATALNVADGNVTIADNLTVSGNLTVTGTTTSVDSTTINTTNAFVFEGANADAYETTLAIVEPTGADKTVYIPNQTGYLPVLASASTTQVSSTPEELNLLDGSSANTVVNSKAVIYGSSGEVAGTLSGAAQTAITSLGTLTALTVDDVAINGKVITMTGDTSDTIVLTAGAAGTLTLVTTDAVGSAADVTIDADGEIVIDAADAAGVIIKINGTAQLSVVDGSITPTTNNDIDLGTASYQFKNGYFDGTLEADAITIGGTNVVTGSLITHLGTVAAGVWQGTAIASGYIANDAIDSQHYADGSIDNAHIADDAIDSEHYADGSIDNAHIADDAIDSEHYADGSIDTAHIADNQVTAAKLADIARGSIIYGNASAATAELTKGGASTVLTSDGTDISWAAAAGGTSIALVLALS